MQNQPLKAYDITFSLKRRKGMRKETQTILAHGRTEREAIHSVHMVYNRISHDAAWRNYRFRIDSVTPYTHNQ